MNKITVKDIENNGWLIYKYIRGSRLYGLNLPPEEKNGKVEEVSDTDIGGVFLEPLDWVLGFDYPPQVEDEKGDKVYYSLKRFLELAQESNPNIIEAFVIPETKVLYKHPIMDTILENRDKFITKNCFPKFQGYAMGQIKKAKGLNKKINYDIPPTKKTILDFCHTFKEGGSQTLVSWLKEHGLKQEFCGLSVVNHMDNMFALYYDWGCHKQFLIDNNCSDHNKLSLVYTGERLGSWMEALSPWWSWENSIKEPFFYKGIMKVQDAETNTKESCEVRLSSIPKGEKPIAHISYSKDAYSTSCRRYLEYVDWIKHRNPQRYKQNVGAGMKMDLKNMTHCCRLLKQAYELAINQGLNIDRTNIDADWLLSIRTGKKTYDEILLWATDMMDKVDNAIPTCQLPEKVDEMFVNDLLIKIRKMQIENKNYLSCK